jgi:hypothetical protein
MRYFAYLLLSLVLWGLADDYLISGQPVSPCASANDDDEYLHVKAPRWRRELAEHERGRLPAFTLLLAAPSTLAEVSLPLSSLQCRVFGPDSCLYVFMSLQI